MKQLKIGKHIILPGERKKIFLKVGKIYDSTDYSMPVQVIRGLKDGPTVFLSAAIHGDEINGIEIIREVVASVLKSPIRGTIIAVPIVNIFGFNNRSRYLPDRRDLNRSFPGSSNGSLASRIAHLFMKEIVVKCTHGIDFHTGAINRFNHPHIRADLHDHKTLEFAKSFGAPIIINSKLRDGSLREAARKKGVLTLLFEGGEAQRFEDHVIKAGREGCLRALQAIGVLSSKKVKSNKIKESSIARGSYWIRSPSGGTLRLRIKEGSFLEKGEKIGDVVDPFGEKSCAIYALYEGYVIGLNRLPLVTIGEAVVHVATITVTKTLRHRLRDEIFYE